MRARMACASFSSAAWISFCDGRSADAAPAAPPIRTGNRHPAAWHIPRTRRYNRSRASFRRTRGLSTAYARLSRRKHERRLGRRGIQLRLRAGLKARRRERKRNGLERGARGVVLPAEMAEDELLRPVFREVYRERSGAFIRQVTVIGRDAALEIDRVRPGTQQLRVVVASMTAQSTPQSAARTVSVTVPRSVQKPKHADPSSR